MRRALPFLLLCPLLTGCGLLRPKPPEYPPVELEGGLIVQDLVIPDDGPEARHGDYVTIAYSIALAGDGTMVDSSDERGQPFRFQLEEGAVFPGLERGLLGMRLKGRRRILVPSEMGYGSLGAPPRIPPDADLNIKVELMELER